MWLTPDDADTAAITEVEEGVDRVVAIVACTIIEQKLSDVVRKQLAADESAYGASIRHKLFGSAGPLAAFGTKIHMGYLLGLYSEAAHKDLITFKDIRNKFAHYREHNTFDSESINSRCSNLTLVDRHFTVASRGMTGIMVHDKKVLVFAGIADPFPDNKAKGRYLNTAKLFCAALSLFHGGQLEKPIL